jgi:hypothetical protein
MPRGKSLLTSLSPKGGIKNLSPWKGEIREGFNRYFERLQPIRISLNPFFQRGKLLSHQMLQLLFVASSIDYLDRLGVCRL